MKKSSIVDYRSVNVKKLSLAKKDGTEFTYQFLNTSQQPVYLKTPKLVLSSTPMKEDGHTYIDLNLKGSLLEDLINQFDEAAVAHLENHSEDLLGKKFSPIALEEIFVDSVKRGHTFRIRIPEDLKVYDNQGFPVNLEEYSLEELLCKGDKITAIIVPRSVRFHKLKSKIVWHVVVIKLNKSISDCPLDSESEDEDDTEDDDEETEEENEKKKSNGTTSYVDSDLDIY